MELQKVDRRVVDIDDDPDANERTTCKLSAKIGNASMAEVLEAVQTTAAEQRSMVDSLEQRLSAVEASPDAERREGPHPAAVDVAWMEAQLRAVERTMQAAGGTESPGRRLGHAPERCETHR